MYEETPSIQSQIHLQVSEIRTGWTVAQTLSYFGALAGS